MHAEDRQAERREHREHRASSPSRSTQALHLGMGVVEKQRPVCPYRRCEDVKIAPDSLLSLHRRLATHRAVRIF